MPVFLCKDDSLNTLSKQPSQSHFPVSDDYPANSRVYFTSSTSLEKIALQKLFESYGTIQSFRLLENKHGKSKGKGFVKYEKASSAAKAIESLNLKHIPPGTEHPLVVEIAHPRGKPKKIYTEEPEDTPARSRLFVVCPKEMKESTLFESFREIDRDGLEYVKIITDKDTRESKGFAFVKFTTASAAAIAMEEISETGEINGMHVKVLVADPKTKSPTSEVHFYTENTEYPMEYNASGLYSVPFMPPPGYYPFYPQMTYPDFYAAPPIPYFIVTSNCAFKIEKLTKIFEDYPGFEHCEVCNPDEQSGFAYITFNSFHTAEMAMEGLQGAEYSSGYPMECSWEHSNVYPSNVPFQPDQLRYQEMYIPQYYPTPINPMLYHQW